MNQIFSIAKKELRGYFSSPVALIFLGTFLCVTLFSFFWVDTFFRRNIADVRPLFNWLPILLIFLVGALTMRLWSEEQRMGTLEILLTLPVKTHRLVLGKFIAGLALVTLALALTLGIPITVSMIGDLDWGPVWGGYLAAMLLASAYLAIGLCLSSTTDNPIVALITTCVGCGLFYLVGSDAVASLAGNRWAEILRSFGVGSRFESIQRGVIDLRDIAYYASLAGSFLFLNIALLEAKRWSQGERTRRKRAAVKVAVALLVANLVVFNVGFAAVRTARLDLTERKEYSISDVTKKLLRNLDAPLTIRGYFSAKTHPLLAPLVPRIRDLLEEYSVVGGEKVRAEFIDPQQNATAEKEANETYGIKSVPFQFADRHEAALVNSYFTVLIKYGDKYEKLDFQDLIEVNVSGMKDVEVKLRNLEYDLTRAIKKVVYGFRPIEEIFARVADKVTMTTYLTEASLPKNFQEVPARIKKVAKEIEERSGGKFVFQLVDPSGAENEKLRQELFEKYGFKPMAASLFAQEQFYLYSVIQAGEKVIRLFPSQEMSEADVQNEVNAALKRLTPGFLKTIGLFEQKESPQMDPMMMMGRRPPPPQSKFQMVNAKLAEDYTVKEVDLKDGRVPGDVDVLLVLGPKNLDEKQQYAIDQFLMRGGAVILAAGRYQMDLGGMRGLSVTEVNAGLDNLLSTWGVKVESKLVLDPQNESFPVPVERNIGGLPLREIRLINYPFFVDVRASGMAEGEPVISGIPSVVLHWASPLTVTTKDSKELKSTVLLASTPESWTQESTNVQPDFTQYPEKGFGSSGPTGKQSLAVSLQGVFASAFKDKPSPLLKSDDPSNPNKPATESGAQASGETLKQSPASARLIVVGSAEFLNDHVLNLSRQTGTDRFTNNLQFVQNLADWAVADVDLLTIRSRGTYARTLKPMEDPERTRWEWINYGIVAISLGLIVGVATIRRRNLEPIVTSKRAE